MGTTMSIVNDNGFRRYRGFGKCLLFIKNGSSKIKYE